MQPPSIINFSRIFLASIALATALAAFRFPALKSALIRQEPTAASLGDGVLALAITLGQVVMLVLWFLIARRASNVAKWILVLLTLLGFALLMPEMRASLSHFAWQPTLSIFVAFLQVIAIAFLFRADAREWLSHDQPLDFADVG